MCILYLSQYRFCVPVLHWFPSFQAWPYQKRFTNCSKVWRHGRCRLALWTKHPLNEFRRTSISPSSSWK
jgi:hypothetical protein